MKKSINAFGFATILSIASLACGGVVTPEEAQESPLSRAVSPSKGGGGPGAARPVDLKRLGINVAKLSAVAHQAECYAARYSECTADPLPGFDEACADVFCTASSVATICFDPCAPGPGACWKVSKGHYKCDPIVING